MSKNNYKILKHKTNGTYAVKLNSGSVIPEEICGLGAGKDAWLRDIEFPCIDCKTKTKAGDLECSMCPDCYEKAGEEIEQMDSGV